MSPVVPLVPFGVREAMWFGLRQVWLQELPVWALPLTITRVSFIWVLYLVLFLTGCCIFETASHTTHASLKLMA